MDTYDRGGDPYNNANFHEEADGSTPSNPDTQSAQISSDDDEALDWGDTVKAGSAKKLLDEGDYNARVSSFTRGRFPGSAKLPACNQAIQKFDIATPEGIVTVESKIPLCKSLSWKIAAFFEAIGKAKKGEDVKMEWDHVIGAECRVHVSQRSFTGRDGKNHIVNDIDKFLPPIEHKQGEPMSFGPGPNRQY